MKLSPKPYRCPLCKWEFGVRKKRCCRGCGTLLLIPSDMPSDSELTALKSFWMWDPVKERWGYTADWEAHKREMMRRLGKLSESRLSDLLDSGKEPLPSKPRLQ